MKPPGPTVAVGATPAIASISVSEVCGSRLPALPGVIATAGTVTVELAVSTRTWLEVWTRTVPSLVWTWQPAGMTEPA